VASSGDGPIIIATFYSFTLVDSPLKRLFF
jgi:hypothetical protein